MSDTPLSGLLLIEIGGTHCRCATASGERGPESVTVFKNTRYPGLESIVTDYLDQLGATAPDRAAIAVAGPVDTQPVHLTNLGWTLDTEALKERFGWSQAVLVNDFEALACAAPLLSDDELLTIRSGKPAPGAAIAVLGPGTGMGVSGLVPCGKQWYPVRGEGGHVTLPAADEREAEILGILRREHGHVSAERVLSGPGLLTLYQTLAPSSRACSPEAVTSLAENGDTHALEALELFFCFLGTFCGDVALTLGARGGVYLGGGILPALRNRLLASRFATRFADKGRFSAYLEPIPVRLIIADTPALRGLVRHPLVAA